MLYVHAKVHMRGLHVCVCTLSAPPCCYGVLTGHDCRVEVLLINDWSVSQMATYSLCSTLLLTKALWTLVKSSALYRERGYLGCYLVVDEAVVLHESVLMLLVSSLYSHLIFTATIFTSSSVFLLLFSCS